jgi:hypothetical protein
MKKIIVLISIFFLILSCNDGDFDVPTFDFNSQTIENCGDLVLFKINGSEAIVFSINQSNTDDTFFKQEMIDNSYSLTNISYRIYSDAVTASSFCNDIPPATPNVSKEWNGNGILIVNNVITKDDEDGVEELDLILDTDSDGFPNYYDSDDDGDGILTKDELDASGVPLDTDGDNILDYLDTDDDNDGVLTLNEFRTDSNGNGINDYLDNTTTIIQVNNSVTNSYKLSYITTFIIENLSLTNSSENTINFDSYDLGAKNGEFTINN